MELKDWNVSVAYAVATLGKGQRGKGAKGQRGKGAKGQRQQQESAVEVLVDALLASTFVEAFGMSV